VVSRTSKGGDFEEPGKRRDKGNRTNAYFRRSTQGLKMEYITFSLTSLSLRSVRSKEKLGSAVQSCSGRRHVRLPSFMGEPIEDVHKGSCLLYAMLMEQSDPNPVE
jgi:hypothetical protein